MSSFDRQARPSIWHSEALATSLTVAFYWEMNEALKRWSLRSSGIVAASAGPAASPPGSCFKEKLNFEKLEPLPLGPEPQTSGSRRSGSRSSRRKKFLFPMRPLLDRVAARAQAAPKEASLPLSASLPLKTFLQDERPDRPCHALPRRWTNLTILIRVPASEALTYVPSSRTSMALAWIVSGSTYSTYGARENVHQQSFAATCKESLVKATADRRPLHKHAAHNLRVVVIVVLRVAFSAKSFCPNLTCACLALWPFFPSG